MIPTYVFRVIRQVQRMRLRMGIAVSLVTMDRTYKLRFTVGAGYGRGRADNVRYVNSCGGVKGRGVGPAVFLAPGVDGGSPKPYGRDVFAR